MVTSKSLRSDRLDNSASRVLPGLWFCQGRNPFPNWVSDYVTLIWRLLLFPFPCYFPGFWSWGTLFPWLPSWFTSGLAWPRSMLFGHCTQLGLFLQLPQLLHCHGSLRALSLKRPSEPDGSRHLVILLTLCWHLHLWYYPSICSFFQQILPNIYGQGFASPGETNTSSYSRGPLLLGWLFPVTPGMCRFVSPTLAQLDNPTLLPKWDLLGFLRAGSRTMQNICIVRDGN